MKSLPELSNADLEKIDFATKDDTLYSELLTSLDKLNISKSPMNTSTILGKRARGITKKLMPGKVFKKTKKGGTRRKHKKQTCGQRKYRRRSVSYKDKKLSGGHCAVDHYLRTKNKN